MQVSDSDCICFQSTASCSAMVSKNPRAAALGRLGGSATSEAKAAAVRENGKLGGRPPRERAPRRRRKKP